MLARGPPAKQPLPGNAGSQKMPTGGERHHSKARSGTPTGSLGAHPRAAEPLAVGPATGRLTDPPIFQVPAQARPVVAPVSTRTQNGTNLRARTTGTMLVAERALDEPAAVRPGRVERHRPTTRRGTGGTLGGREARPTSRAATSTNGTPRRQVPVRAPRGARDPLGAPTRETIRGALKPMASSRATVVGATRVMAAADRTGPATTTLLTSTFTRCSVSSAAQTRAKSKRRTARWP
mmetsp:Transcript_25507/g.62031  ORF Transcript_25507/g.62031 Transcript_25507/m.62031 type:complete len:236 (-) Transcript_25507:1362-2069(-)